MRFSPIGRGGVFPTLALFKFHFIERPLFAWVFIGIICLDMKGHEKGHTAPKDTQALITVEGLLFFCFVEFTLNDFHF